MCPRHEDLLFFIQYSETVIDHNSSLIRIFAKSDRLGGSDFNGIDVFLYYYLKQVHEFEDMLSSTKRLIEEIAREENKENSNGIPE